MTNKMEGKKILVRHINSDVLFLMKLAHFVITLVLNIRAPFFNFKMANTTTLICIVVV